jgi:hypothetical protein
MVRRKPFGTPASASSFLAPFGSYRLELRADAEEAVGQELAGLDRHAFHHAADDGVTVDRHRDGLAHAQVAQRVLDRVAVLGAHER